jgi:hypothetical protein
VDNNITFNWWRLFHSLLRHGRSDAELSRSKAVWAWMNDHYVILKRVAIANDVQFDLLAAIWKVAHETNDLPSYDILLEEVQDMEKNAELIDALKNDYTSQSDLRVHDPEDLRAVLKAWCTDWEMRRITNALKIANAINLGSLELDFQGERNKKMSGPRDAINYLVERMESGLLVDNSTALAPLVVQNEAPNVADRYLESLREPQLPSGFAQFHIERQDFVGILGYLGGGKSTVGRFILYQMAEGGSNVLHISLENPQSVEVDKFTFLHAHHPKFGGHYDSLLYTKRRKRQLTKRDLEMLREVGDDFKATVGGRIVVRQPSIVTWPHIKTLIEVENRVQPLDAVLIDYIQLIDSPDNAKRFEDHRVRMTSMVKDIRQFGITFDGGRKLCIISPIQANEEGLEKAVTDGVFKASAINNDKELGRSMTYVIGVFNRGAAPGGEKELVISSVKEREGAEFAPFITSMSGSGWLGKKPAVRPAKDSYDPALECLLETP